MTISMARANGRRSPVLTANGADHSVLGTVFDPRDGLPLSEGLAFLQEAVGGALVAGARYVISGGPGGGKSRVATQVCLDLGRQQIPTLTILTEESPAQLKRRALQMTADWSKTHARQAMTAMQVEENIYDVAALPDFLMRQVLSSHGAYHGVRLIVLDSIQGHGLAGSATKAYAKVLEFARMCEESRITTLLLCHTTKKGDLAGPRSLEHSVDTSLVLRRAMLYSLLAVRKNRYGPPLLKPLPLRINPVSTRLEPAPHCEARPAMARTYAGAGSGLLELQAAVTVPADGTRGRMTAPGLPRREIEQLIGCISGMQNLDFSELDYTVHCRLPGNGQYQPHLGLPLCISLIGSYLRHAVPESHLYLGEIDLFRSVRPIPAHLIQELRSALDGGEVPLPVRLFLPTSAVQEFAGVCPQVQVVGCRTLEDALFQTWPDLR